MLQHLVAAFLAGGRSFLRERFSSRQLPPPAMVHLPSDPALLGRAPRQTHPRGLLEALAVGAATHRVPSAAPGRILGVPATARGE